MVCSKPRQGPKPTSAKKYIAPFHEDIHFFYDNDLQIKVVERYNKENPGVDYKKSLEDIVDFLDFGGTFVILKKNNVFLTKQTNDVINSIFNDLVSIIPVRNRVMHTRPLLGGDFAIVYDFITKLKMNDPIEYPKNILSQMPYSF